ncbi:Hsp33 family molecular chaperone HslO [Parapedomonas caeni]
MSSEAILLDSTNVADVVLPFQVDGLDVRGRIARLGPTLDAVLAAHAYPAAVARLLAEALTLTALLGSVLREEGGQLTLQAKSNGPVSLLVTDYKAPGEVRGYAEFDPEKIAGIEPGASLPELFGEGYLALTVDQTASNDRYQGIVALEGASLAEAAGSYFETSEQLPSRVRLAVRHDGLANRWYAGGLLIQHLPRGEEGAQRLFAADAPHPNWQHATVLADTLRDEELTDPSLTLETVLWRLFHQDQPRIYTPIVITKGCRCTRERIQSVLRQFSFNELMDMREPDGAIRVNCAFCSKDFVFERPAEKD